jgi:hypothetical protein
MVTRTIADKRPLKALARTVTPANKVTEGGVGRVEALSAELRKFGEDVEAGQA